MDNDRSKALKSRPVKGSVAAHFNRFGDFKSDSIHFHHFPEGIFVDARMSVDQRLITFYFANDTLPGTYDVAAENSTVQVYYYNSKGPTPWTYKPSTGTLILTELDVANLRCQATFYFTATDVPNGEEPLHVTQGALETLGAAGGS